MMMKSQRGILSSLGVVVFLAFWGTSFQSQPSRNEQSVLALVWYQTAAETRALCYQAYNLARMMLDQGLSSGPAGRPKAVVVDIDETLLDNSPYNAKQVFSSENYPKGWREWVELAQAGVVPGSLEFLRYADQKGVQVFYVTNRRVVEGPATLKNLQRLGFPQARPERLFLRDTEDSKEPRRKKIAEQYDVVLLVGDNLNDFADVFEEKSMQQRAAAVDRLKDQFGRRFIVLPNPFYGDWEGAVYKYNWQLSDEEKNRLRKEALRVY
jgi:5'-nucleotidase (lipoprotein e(P4) family)